MSVGFRRFTARTGRTGRILRGPSGRATSACKEPWVASLRIQVPQVRPQVRADPEVLGPSPQGLHQVRWEGGEACLLLVDRLQGIGVVRHRLRREERRGGGGGRGGPKGGRGRPPVPPQDPREKRREKGGGGWG